MEQDTLPYFKYHPDPLSTGVIKHEQTLCPCCNQLRPYVYISHFYSVHRVEGLCPWCIADGSAAAKFNGDFQDSICCEPVGDPRYLDELLYRTPGYSGWQQEHWLSHCNDFCAYLGNAHWETIKPFIGELQPDIDTMRKDLKLAEPEIKEYLRNISKGSFCGYWFQCIHCGKHRFCWDYD